MNTKHRNRAIANILAGLFLLCLIVLLITARQYGVPDVLVALGSILLAIGGLYLYFRGCFTLAEAKGYSGGMIFGAMLVGALCIPGLLFVLPLLLAFVLKDKNARHYPRPRK